ncbi:Major facilitator Superfamily [Vibrio sp. B1FIG11]|nr:Major facilitator Superfamily [Vibrio sp. B1FIG11]CAE6960963.1 Major facilitator Superfamily [Vibrio sp. B1FIG11]
MGIPFYLFGFGLICAGFSIGFGVAMSQALNPFSLRAGLASSLLGIAQVCCSALYIWFMGFIGVNALNMLVFVLATGGAISLALILFTPKHAYESHYEEISSPS